MAAGAHLSIRKAVISEVDRLLEIFEAAKRFMRSTGNMEQWAGNYPQRSMIEAEIASGVCHVIEDEDGRAVGTFAMIPGDDPTYAYIEGEWKFDTPYVTIHRLASDGSHKGLGQLCFDYAMRVCGHVRVDTHRDNIPMQNLVTKCGFEYCGIIYLEDGNPRLAYEKQLS